MKLKCVQPKEKSGVVNESIVSVCDCVAISPKIIETKKNGIFIAILFISNFFLKYISVIIISNGNTTAADFDKAEQTNNIKENNINLFFYSI